MVAHHRGTYGDRGEILGNAILKRVYGEVQLAELNCQNDVISLSQAAEFKMILTVVGLHESDYPPRESELRKGQVVEALVDHFL